VRWGVGAGFIFPLFKEMLARFYGLKYVFRLNNRVGIVGGLGVAPLPSSCLQTLIFRVKIDFKFQSLGKISNISAADPQFF